MCTVFGEIVELLRDFGRKLKKNSIDVGCSHGL
jgi:hypothetical protein